MDTPLGLNITLKTDYTTALTRVTDALKAEGFGVLTEIDVKETLKKKLGRGLHPLQNPRGLQPAAGPPGADDRPEVGLLLPCNVVVRQIEDGVSEVSLIDPLGMMAMISNPELQAVAQEARTKLERVAASLKA